MEDTKIVVIELKLALRGSDAFFTKSVIASGWIMKICLGLSLTEVKLVFDCDAGFIKVKFQP